MHKYLVKINISNGGSLAYYELHQVMTGLGFAQSLPDADGNDFVFSDATYICSDNGVADVCDIKNKIENAMGRRFELSIFVCCFTNYLVMPFTRN
ncbi:type V toxin-antitoxin system endoribonuclease antitoxin GhoS [Serratia marcescens]|uniref:type V toxin-antitoxin system endoribonuclease antitoxin GhoS n=1 Tax=Serratia marcescens TaxID=615 RepID=UPI00124A6A5D|nr:type V toxin-antitoxin system endoribonuclease antitoxin GhoS [Serratia marcescens]KAB1578734.1 hypothetical protein F7687_22630 [Serratia marcescens]